KTGDTEPLWRNLTYSAGEQIQFSMDGENKLKKAVESMNTPCLVFSKLIMVALPIAQVVIVPPKLFLPGAMYLEDCPKQHYIPIYLVVCGVFSIVLAVFSCLPCCKAQECICNLWNGLVSAFMFCWYITGNVWIYSIYTPNYNATLVEEPYCNKTLYLFAFWTTTLGYILFAGALVGTCCVLCSACCAYKIVSSA
ncbi:hypothetical protein NFI96_024044, partial [Prochilodus magdalenae]